MAPALFCSGSGRAKVSTRGRLSRALPATSRCASPHWAKAGEKQVVVLSTKEKSIGVSSFKNGRLTFPEALPIPDDEPLLLEVADLNGDKQPEILFVSRVRQSRSSDYVLHALERNKEGKWRPYMFGPAKTPQIAIDISSTPTALMKFDAKGDGRPSFLLFQGTDHSPLVLAGKADGSLAALPGDGGMRLGSVGAGAVFYRPLENAPPIRGASHKKVPTILVAQENFARKLQPGSDQEWRVVDQYNASEPSAKIVGSAMIDLDGKPDREVVLVDTGIRKIRVLRREGDLFRPWKEIELGSFPYEAAPRHRSQRRRAGRLAAHRSRPVCRGLRRPIRADDDRGGHLREQAQEDLFFRRGRG